MSHARDRLYVSRHPRYVAHTVEGDFTRIAWREFNGRIACTPPGPAAFAWRVAALSLRVLDSYEVRSFTDEQAVRL